jgi:vacuole morphology and inheritance protein 14
VAALDIERLVREAVTSKDEPRIVAIVTTLADLAHSSNYNARSGAIMGLAGVSIALGFHDIPRHLPLMVPPILNCFIDSDPKVRYFACESMYNVAKVAKGEILVYFNELFDAMAKVRHSTSRMDKLTLVS